MPLLGIETWASRPQPSNHTRTNYQMEHKRILSTQQFTCYMRKNRDRINCSAISATFYYARTHTCANTHTDCPLSLTRARQLYLSKSLHPPGYPVTAAVLGTAIKDTSAREFLFVDRFLVETSFVHYVFGRVHNTQQPFQSLP